MNKRGWLLLLVDFLHRIYHSVKGKKKPTLPED